jgi:hypothetical protein
MTATAKANFASVVPHRGYDTLLRRSQREAHDPCRDVQSSDAFDAQGLQRNRLLITAQKRVCANAIAKPQDRP